MLKKLSKSFVLLDAMINRTTDPELLAGAEERLRSNIHILNCALQTSQKKDEF